MEANQAESISFPGGVNFARTGKMTFDSLVSVDVVLPALVAAQTNGALTTRTDNDTGVVTLSTGHGIATSDVVDVYWSGGVRYGMTATVAGNLVTVDGGAGDNLPVLSTTITAVAKQVEMNPLDLDGDTAQVIAVVYRNASDTGANAHMDLQDSGAASIRAADLVHETTYGGLDEFADIENGDTNNYTGNPITVGYFSHDSTEAASVFVRAGLVVTQ